MFVQKSGSGDLVMCASAFCCWSLPAMIGAAKVTGGLAYLYPEFLTNLEGKVGKVGKVGKIGKVGKVGRVGKVGKAGKEGRLREKQLPILY